MTAASLSVCLRAVVSAVSLGTVACSRIAQVGFEQAESVTSEASNVSKGSAPPEWVWYFASGETQATSDGQLNMNLADEHKLYFSLLSGQVVSGTDATESLRSEAKFIPFRILTAGTCFSMVTQGLTTCKEWRNAVCRSHLKKYDWATKQKVKDRCWCSSGMMEDLIHTTWDKCIPVPGVCQQMTKTTGDCGAGKCSTGYTCRDKTPSTAQVEEWILQVKAHWEMVTSRYSPEKIEAGDLSK